MGGNDNTAGPAPAQAYSTQLTDNGSGYSADGYSVVIDAQTLQAAADTFTKQLTGQTRMQLHRTLSSSVVDPGSFGSIPGNADAYAAVDRYVSDHLDAMNRMGISLNDFIGRVQAAAQLGTEADPVTKAEATRAAAMFTRMAF